MFRLYRRRSQLYLTIIIIFLFLYLTFDWKQSDSNLNEINPLLNHLDDHKHPVAPGEHVHERQIQEPPEINNNNNNNNNVILNDQNKNIVENGKTRITMETYVAPRPCENCPGNSFMNIHL